MLTLPVLLPDRPSDPGTPRFPIRATATELYTRRPLRAWGRVDVAGINGYFTACFEGAEPTGRSFPGRTHPDPYYIQASTP